MSKKKNKGENKNLAIYLVILVVLILVLIYSILACPFKSKILNTFFCVFTIQQQKLSPSEIMEIIKTDKDYPGLSVFVLGFNPEIVAYTKLGPNEYQKIKSRWQQQGLESRVKIVDGINLTNSTHWIELKNKNDQTKGLRMIIDTKTKTSLLLMASLSINAGVGM